MTISARVVADTVWDGPRITTMHLRYPRFIHSQFMTHRMFSRNAASSRAVPISKVIEAIRNDPARPIHWGKNQKGMQAETELDMVEKLKAAECWDWAMNSAINAALDMEKIGVHKQVTNRILEPFLHIDVLCTATDWDNFFEQRMEEHAQPEMQELAQCMFTALQESTPVEDTDHMPFAPDGVSDRQVSLRVAVARCARISYAKFDHKTIQDDLDLYEKLKSSKHLSPFEHVAFSADPWTRYDNFRAWKSLRRIVAAGG